LPRTNGALAAGGLAASAAARDGGQRGSCLPASNATDGWNHDDNLETIVMQIARALKLPIANVTDCHHDIC
jgi:hypothetical protein